MPKRVRKDIKSLSCDREVAIPGRFERSTYCLEGSCSIQLSYGTDGSIIVDFHQIVKKIVADAFRVPRLHNAYHKYGCKLCVCFFVFELSVIKRCIGPIFG